MILNSERNAVEAGLAKRANVIGAEAAWIDFDSRFDIGSELESRPDAGAKLPDLIGSQKSRCTAAEVQLHHFALRIQHLRHQVHLLVEIPEVGGAVALFLRDYGIAAAIPAESLTKRDMEIEGQVAGGDIILANFVENDVVRNLICEVICRRVRGVPWTGDVVFPDQGKIDFHAARLC